MLFLIMFRSYQKSITRSTEILQVNKSILQFHFTNQLCKSTVSHQDLNLPYVFLCYHEKKIGCKIILLNLKLLSIEGTLMIYSYCLTQKHHIEKLWNCLNHQHKNIRFTSDTENENSISFTDIQRSRGNNQFTTSIHRKPPFSRVFPTLEASSRSHINTTFCLPYHRGHSNFAQFWNFLSGNRQAKDYFWK